MSAKTQDIQCYIWVISHCSKLGNKIYKQCKRINKTNEYIIIMYTENPKESTDFIKVNS